MRDVKDYLKELSEIDCALRKKLEKELSEFNVCQAEMDKTKNEYHGCSNILKYFDAAIKWAEDQIKKLDIQCPKGTNGRVCIIENKSGTGNGVSGTGTSGSNTGSTYNSGSSYNTGSGVGSSGIGENNGNKQGGSYEQGSSNGWSSGYGSTTSGMGNPSGIGSSTIGTSSGSVPGGSGTGDGTNIRSPGGNNIVPLNFPISKLNAIEGVKISSGNTQYYISFISLMITFVLFF